MTMTRADSRRKHLFEKVLYPFLWAEQFQKQLAVSKRAEQAFDRLVTEGCDATQLLLLIENVCSVPAQKRTLAQRELAEKMRELAKITSKTAHQIEAVAHAGAPLGGAQSLEKEDYKNLKTILRSLSKELLEEVVFWEMAGGIKPKRKGGTRKEPREAVARLISHLEGTTGDQHLQEAADLLTAYYKSQGINRSVAVRGLERQVKRFRAERSVSYDFFKEFAKSIQSELP